MKTITRMALILGASYMLTGCSNGSSNNNATSCGYVTTNGVSTYQCTGTNAYGTNGYCPTEATPTGTCASGQGLGWSNELQACLQEATCQGANLEQGAIVGCTYGLAPNGSSCWPVHPF